MSVRIAAGGDAGEAITRVVPRLVDEHVASGLVAQDPDLWGPDARAGAARRLGWTEAVADARPLIEDVERLREEFAATGATRVVLCASGVAATAAQVIAATQGVPLTVLDSVDPAVVRRVLDGGLQGTVVVLVGSAHGTVEADAHRRSVEQALRDDGVDPVDRLVVVAQDGSALAAAARAAGYRLFGTEASTTDRFSALGAAALVPAGLAGADLGELLDEAESELLDLSVDQAANNALVLAAGLAGANPTRSTLLLVADGTHLVGFGDWVARLVAGATGAAGAGLVPVVAEVGAPELDAPDDGVQVVRLVADATDDRWDDRLRSGELLLSGTLGELLLVWEHAVAIAARLIGVDPFGEPDAGALDIALRARLSGSGPAGNGIRSIPLGARAEDAPAVDEALTGLLAAVPGGLVVLAYADPAEHPRLPELRDVLAPRARRPVTFGWSPAYVDSARRLLVDGPPVGVLMVTAAAEDRPIPDAAHGYAALLGARMRADAAALTGAGRPVLHVHLSETGSDLALLTAAGR